MSDSILSDDAVSTVTALYSGNFKTDVLEKYPELSKLPQTLQQFARRYFPAQEHNIIWLHLCSLEYTCKECWWLAEFLEAGFLLFGTLDDGDYLLLREVDSKLCVILLYHGHDFSRLSPLDAAVVLEEDASTFFETMEEKGDHYIEVIRQIYAEGKLFAYDAERRNP